MPLTKKSTDTTDDIYALPEGQRAELIDGVIYDMAPPNRIHQEIVMNFSAAIHDYIKNNHGDCKVYPAPFAVFLNAGTKRIDYGIKLFKYRSSGVREYWIVNPLTQTVNVYDLEGDELSDQYTFDDDIPVCIYDGLIINISTLLK